MKHNVLPGADKYRKAHRQKKWWYRVVTCLAAVVVFCTTYALILPAITMEGEVCGLQEHTHSLECYTQVTSVSVREPVCTQESLNLHRHTQDCYDANGELICGYADFVVHTHDASCYTEDGSLWCPLPEIKAHTHTAGCYWIPETEEGEVHTHTEGCYTLERRALVCTEPTGHIHDESCYITSTQLVCEIPESEEHQHGESCYGENGALVCGLEETQGHTHGENCYKTVTELTCALAEEAAHQHTDECYEWNEVLICELSIGQAETKEPAVPSEPELICGKEEVILHRHTEDCFDANGSLICGRLQILEHVHTEDCFRTIEEPVDTDSLTCTLEEGEGAHTHEDSCYDESGGLICERTESAGHQHNVLCYGTWELTCGLPEHTHTKACLPEEESEKPYICGLEAHTHDENCYNEAGELTCELDTHAHTEACLQKPELTEEELAQVDEVITLIDGLPTSEEAENVLASFAETEDPDGLEAYLSEMQPRIQVAVQAYEALTQAQQSYVSNAGKLEELDWLLQEQIIHVYPALTEDGAMVSELMATGSSVVLADPELSVSSGTVHNQDTIRYCFNVKTKSYSDDCFGQARVRLEFVLPLTAEQAAFDMEAMPWLDSTEGYAPCVTTETRMMGDKEVSCQVLTGYKLLSQQGQSDPVIPGEFTETVAVSVQNVAYGESISVQISAAMEFNTWNGSCEAHQIAEKLTVVTDARAVVCSMSEEELQAIYEQFLAEIEELEAFGELDEEMRVAAEDLLQRLQEAHQLGQLTNERFTELHERAFTVLYGDVNSVAEAAVGTNWVLLRDSGWFDAYSGYAGRSFAQVSAASYSRTLLTVDGDAASAQPSDVQVADRGGTNTSDDGTVSVSKTISGTELENVFDITLQVQTSVNVAEICEEPDMAVVIVMDISNTMNSNFGGVTRYAAAMDAAENFLDKFAENNSLGISKVGYVAFNTDAHQIFDLQSCSDSAQANALKNTMRTLTGSIIIASGYSDAHTRFTNVEAGLAMASDMLNGVSNKNKYIIFLSDGFPTTYISSGYSGYDPYDSTGRFYDHVLNKPCLYGTSYSDEAAIRARNKAAAIKSSGVTIFSIGVDVAGQTIQAYITQSENANGFSVVDRTGTTYEIGDASSTEAYKNWLRYSIGSGYYYDSTDSAGLTSAYNQIFEEIKHQVEAGSVADWVASDPIPTVEGAAETVEFIGFYDKTPDLVSGDLEGEHEPNGENTASFHADSSSISWDLKQSGYQEASSGGTKTYTYTLVYRVRLENENGSFTEETVYPTNDTTTLQYRTVEGTDGNLTVSDPKTVDFPIPSVKGYLSELTFCKVKANGLSLAGAEFTLHHDTEQCSICRGNGTSVDIPDQVAVSGADGAVRFTNIPSGHKYTLTETKIPDGYSANGDTYQVEVAYDKLTVTVRSSDGTEKEWTAEIKNNAYHELPATGGTGTYLYMFSGIAVMALVLMYIYKRRKGVTSP